jgi:hypothetical protein
LHDVTETLGHEERGLSTSLDSIHDVTKPSEQNDVECTTHDSLDVNLSIHDVTETSGLDAAVPKRKDGKVHETTRSPPKRKDGRVHGTILGLEPSEQNDVERTSHDSLDAGELSIHDVTETLWHGAAVGRTAKQGLSPSLEPSEYAPKRKDGKVHGTTLGLDPSEQNNVERQSPDLLDAVKPSMPGVTETVGHEAAVGRTAKRGLSPKRDEASRSGKARRTVVSWAPSLEPSEHDAELRNVRKNLQEPPKDMATSEEATGICQRKMRRRRRIRQSCCGVGIENLLRRCRRWRLASRNGR